MATGDRNLRVVAPRAGPPAVLELVEEPVPEPKAGEALVRVIASGVAWADVMSREGIYPGTTFPCTPGYDIVGTVEALGPNAGGDVAIGDTVAALTVHGGYASYVVLPETDLVRVPGGLDPAEAVSLVLNYVTAYQMLHRCVDAVAGDPILVHGAAGGVGTALLQFARRDGLRAIGTASARKHDTVRSLGGTPIDYHSKTANAEIREAAGGGVQAAFDPIGGSSWSSSYELLRPGGTLVAYGASTVFIGGRFNLLRGLGFVALTRRYAPRKLLAEAKGVVGYNIGEWKRARPALFRTDLTALFGLLASREIVPLIAERIPLREARRAHELLGAADATGKIVLMSNVP